MTALAVGSGIEARPARPALHVLILPSWYPAPDRPLAGIFFREQALAVADRGLKIGVIHPDLRSLRGVGPGGLIRHRFGIRAVREGSLDVLRATGWTVPRSEALQRWWWVRCALRLASAYRERHGRPDLIHAQSLLWAGVAARRIAAAWSVPYVVTEHRGRFVQGGPARLVKAAARDDLVAALRASAGVTAVSTALARGLKELAGPPELPVEVIPNMVDTTFFTLPPAARPTTGFHCVMIANLSPAKGGDVLLRAFASLVSELPEATLTICGDGPAGAALRRQAAALDGADRVRFTGALGRPALRELLWTAHCLVLPTLFESFGLVLAEAMATGLPVVSTRAGGPEDIVTPAVGFLVEPGDSAALAAALRAVHARRDAWDQRRIRAAASERYSRPAVAERIAGAYERAVAPATGSRALA